MQEAKVVCSSAKKYKYIYKPKERIVGICLTKK